MRVRPGGRETARGNGNTGEASLTDGDQRVMERERQRETSRRARMSQGEGLCENGRMGSSRVRRAGGGGRRQSGGEGGGVGRGNGCSEMSGRGWPARLEPPAS